MDENNKLSGQVLIVCAACFVLFGLIVRRVQHFHVDIAQKSTLWPSDAVCPT